MIGKLATPLFVKLAAGVGLALLVTIGVLSWQLAGARSALSDKDVQIGGLQRDILHQNTQIEAVAAAGQAALARTAAQHRLDLEAVARQQPVIVSLRESGGRVRGAGERCEISQALREAEGL